jgi:fatty acid desaturase
MSSIPVPHAEASELQAHSVKETPSWLDQFSQEEKPRVAKLVRELSRPSNLRSAAAIGFDYAVIALAMWAYTTWANGWFYPLLVIIVGARQHGLLILMHDASHYRLFSSRVWNERLANWLCAWPFFVRTETYRRSHLEHHNFLNTERDPDWMLKVGKPEWTFPKSCREVIALLGAQMAGRGLIENVRRLIRFNQTVPTKAAARGSILPRLAYYLSLAAALTWAGRWWEFLLFWVVPFCTFVPFALRLRSIAEHFGLPAKTEFSKSRHVDVGWLERFLFAPHFIACHTAHHLFPSVPFFQLGRLHRALLEFPSYRAQVHINDSYLFGRKGSVLQDLQSPRAHRAS